MRPILFGRVYTFPGYIMHNREDSTHGIHSSIRWNWGYTINKQFYPFLRHPPPLVRCYIVCFSCLRSPPPSSPPVIFDCSTERNRLITPTSDLHHRQLIERCHVCPANNRLVCITNVTTVRSTVTLNFALLADGHGKIGKIVKNCAINIEKRGNESKIYDGFYWILDFNFYLN